VGVLSAFTHAALIHSEGGPVPDASDGTSAENAAVRVYNPSRNTEIAEGTVNLDISGTWYWLFDVGIQLATDWVAGDDHLTIIGKELNPGTAAHAGYYAVINKDITSADPDEFPSANLRMMPSPNVRADNLSVVVTWNNPVEDTGNPDRSPNIVGFDIYRSLDNITFAQVSTNVSDTSYVDNAVSSNVTYYYALGYIYRSNITSNMLSAGSGPVVPSYPPITPNAIYPTDNLTAIPARPTAYNVSFVTTEDIDHDSVQLDIYFGQEGSALTLVTQNMWLWAGDITGYNVGTINAGLTYNWKVIAKDADHDGVQSEGPTWSFRTQDPGEIDRFEDGTVDLDPDWFIYDGVSINTVNSTAEGSFGMAVNGSAADWYVGGTGVTYWQDVSTFSYLALDIKNDYPDSNQASLVITEEDGDTWTYAIPVSWSTWQGVNIPLSVFTQGGSGDGIYNPTAAPGGISQVQMNLLYADSGDFNDTIGFSTDDLRFSQSGSLTDEPPRIISIVPSGNDYFAPLNSAIRITFSEAMDQESAESSLGISPETPGSFSWFGNTMIFTPMNPLEASTTYNVSFNASAVTDLDGQTLAGTNSWQFNTTGAGSSGYNPEVIGWSPVGDDVPLNPTIEIIFSEGISQNTVAGNIIVSDGNGSPVSGTGTWLDNTFIFTPDAPLDASTQYTVTVNTGLEDVNGDNMSSTFSWTFETGTGGGQTPPTVLAHSPVGSGVSESRPTISILFSEAMNQGSVESSFQSSGNIGGVFSWTGNLLQFTPTEDLNGDSWYTITINAGALDSEGDSLVSSNVFSFQIISADTIPPGRITDITPSQNGSTLILMWESSTDNVTATSDMRFNIYRSTTINFSTSVNIVSVTTNRVISVTNDTSASLNFYLIKAVDEAGNESVTSAVVFRLDKFLVYNASPTSNINWISVPYNSPYATAREIVDHINGGSTPGTVTKIHQFTNSQESENLQYFFGSWVGDNFTVTPGMSYAVIVNADTNFTLIGMHDETVTVSRAYNAAPTSNINWISIPYNSSYTTAQDVVNAINGGATPGTVTKIHWFTNAQESRNLQYFFGSWVGDDFEIIPGQGYAVIINGNTEWKPEVMYPE